LFFAAMFACMAATMIATLYLGDVFGVSVLEY
jgi:hypothetical protein